MVASRIFQKLLCALNNIGKFKEENSAKELYEKIVSLWSHAR